MGQMGNGRRNDITAPSVFNGHGYPQGNTKVSGLARPSEPTELRNLDIHAVNSAVLVTFQDGGKTVNTFIQHKGQRGAPADGKAFFVGRARLLDVYIDVFYAINHLDGVVHEPARMIFTAPKRSPYRDY